MFVWALCDPFISMYVLGVVEIPCGDIRSDSILLVDINYDILTDRCLEKFCNRENTGETLSVSFPDF